MEGISIVLTTYNGATRGFLEEAINSALNQTYDKYELIIIDDGSKDNTKQICQKYLKNKNVSYIYQENKGLAFARNTGIKNSKYKYICFLDDDDVYMPNKLEKQIIFFRKNKDKKIGILFTWAEQINEQGDIIGDFSRVLEGDIYERLLYEGYCTNSPSTVMVKKEVFDNIGGFNEKFRYVEDYEMWCRLSKHYHVYSLNEPLIKSRSHTAKMSSNIDLMEHYQTLAIKETLQNAPSHIDKNRVYYRLYKHFAQVYFNVHDYKKFREKYKQVKKYHSPSYGLRYKYLISFIPFLTRIFRKFS